MVEKFGDRVLDAIVPPKPEEWMKVFPHTNSDLFLLERYPFEQVEKVLGRTLSDAEKNALESSIYLVWGGKRERTENLHTVEKFITNSTPTEIFLI